MRKPPLRGVVRRPRSRPPAAARFRVWITRYDNWQPAGSRSVPPRATAIEPAEEGTMSAREATAYAAAFNRAILRTSRKLWAVALPVTVRYEGEPKPGEEIMAGAPSESVTRLRK